MKGQRIVHTAAKKPHISIPDNPLNSESLLYPVTIIKDKYYGKYSGGTWLAFNLEGKDIPSEISSDDMTCYNFWNKNKDMCVGKGFEPSDAFYNLYNRVKNTK